MSLAIHPIDLAIVCLYLGGVTLFGLWLGRGQTTNYDYLLGGRNLPWWAVLLSIVATETSAVTVLSVPGVAYARNGDMRFLQLALGYMLGRVVIVFLFLPHYFKGELFTAYDVLHRRFGGATRQTASLLFLVTRNLADGLRLFLAAIVLQNMSGLNLNICVAVLGVITIIYTFAGGIKSVVWTDCLQFAMYNIAAILAGIVLLRLLPGGVDQLFAFGREHEKFQVFDFSLDFSDKYTFAAGLIGGLFLTLATHGADHMMVQRYLSARSSRDASRALVTSGIVVCVQFAMFLLLGIGLACFYHLHPPQTELANDEAFARFLVDHMPVGILGLTLAAVFSASMSGSLNSLAGAAVNDLYAPWLGEKSASHLLWASRVFTVIFGVVQIGVGMAGPYFAKSVIDSVLAIASFSTGVVLGVFFLGILTRRVSQRAALGGLWVGLTVMCYVAFGARLPFVAPENPADLHGVWRFHIFATSLAWPWYAFVGSMTVFLTGFTLSFIWPHRTEGPASVNIEINTR